MMSPEARVVFAVVLAAALVAGGALLLERSASPSGAVVQEVAAGVPVQVVLAEGMPLVIDFADYFGVDAIFSATNPRNITTRVAEGKLTVLPEQGFVGERVVVVAVASNGRVVEHAIKIVVLPEER